MTALSHIPTRAEARQDPAHAAWWPLVDAVEAVRRAPTRPNIIARDRAAAGLLRALDAREVRR